VEPKTTRHVAPFGGSNATQNSKLNHSKESTMSRLLISTGIALFMALTPALAADQATPSGGADTSTGAKEQSSAPPSSGAASDAKPAEAVNPSSGSADTSGGAKEQSSAPPESSAADPSKPNPTLGTDKE
jgi:hypothetical protein